MAARILNYIPWYVCDVCVEAWLGPTWALLQVPNSIYFSWPYHIQSTFTIFIRNDKSVREKWNIHKTIKFIANQIYIYRIALDTFPDLRLNCINASPFGESISPAQATNTIMHTTCVRLPGAHAHIYILTYERLVFLREYRTMFLAVASTLWISP